MATVTTERLRNDFDSVRSLIDRGETFSFEENGVTPGMFLPVRAEPQELFDQQIMELPLLCAHALRGKLLSLIHRDPSTASCWRSLWKST